jgi:hypothetical protein
MKKYPKGPIRQHHALATGVGIQTANKAKKGGGFDAGSGHTPASSVSSSGDTGGPKCGKVPSSNMTPA